MKSRSNRRLARSLQKSIGLLGRRVGKLRQSTKSILHSLTDFEDHDIVISRSVTRRAPDGKNYFNPLFLTVSFFQFFIRYLSSRRVIPLFQGLPAVVALVSPIIMVSWIAPDNEELYSQTKIQRDFYDDHGNFESADFFARKLCFLRPGEPTPLLERADLLHRNGDSDEAMAIALELVSRNEFAPAMEWICRRELEEIRTLSQPDEVREKRVIGLLLRILEIDPDHVRANFMLGAYYLMRGQYSNAQVPLERVNRYTTEPIPEAAFSLAQIHGKIGNRDAARRHASLAADGFMKQISVEEYSTASVIQLLKALILAERENEAESFIHQQLPNRTEQETVELNWLLGEVCAQWARRLRTQPRRTAEEFAEAIKVIHRGIAVAPSNPYVRDELTRLACSDHIDDETLEQQLNIILDSGVSPGLVHFIKGTRLLTKTPPDTAGAMGHLEIAMEHDEAFPGLLNNVANAILEQPTPDLDQALVLAEQALHQMPNQPHFLDTRGSIYSRMGEHVKAIADFERALSESELRGELHRKLAEEYGQIGNTEEAERQRNMSKVYETEE